MNRLWICAFLATALLAQPALAQGRDPARLRVATKYVQTAREHFAAKGVHVDLIKLYGSMELAPLVGLADAIVDLVSSGNTLKAKMKKMNMKFFSSPIVFIKYDKTNAATQKKAEKELTKWGMLEVARRDDGLKYVILYRADTKEKLEQINYDDDIEVMEGKIRQALSATR